MIDYSDWSERNRRLDALIASIPKIIDHAIRKNITEHRDGKGRNRSLAAIVTMFSGGNDSIILSHLMRERTDYFGHANTGIGIEDTRIFVRKTCAEWGVPLIERFPAPGRTYREYVLKHGFPGPGRHGYVFARIKGSPFEIINKELVSNPYRQRVLFVGGRRMLESARREARKVPVWERRKSIAWVSPLRGWTALDLQTYRARFPDTPRNPVADDLGMSGECECGAFAAPGELNKLRAYPPAAGVVAQIEDLEREAEVSGIRPDRCLWGWGANPFRTCRNGCNL